MKKLPYPKTYEEEFRYMPWGKLIQEVIEVIVKKTPQNAKVVDLMCGPGYLLGQIKKKRPDLKLKGVDINVGFIKYAREKYKEIIFEQADALIWEPDGKYNVVICTAGLHHIPYEKQEEFVYKLHRLTDFDKQGFAIVADPYIDDYDRNYEKERKLAAAKLGYEYLLATMKNGAPNHIISACIDIMHNDIMRDEYKTAAYYARNIFFHYFNDIEMHQTWPKEEAKNITHADFKSEYGDYYFVLTYS